MPVLHAAGTCPDCPPDSGPLVDLRISLTAWWTNWQDRISSSYPPDLRGLLMDTGALVSCMTMVRNREAEPFAGQMNLLLVALSTVLLKLAKAQGEKVWSSRCGSQALYAALAARNAAIEGDTATVDEFARTWLDLTRPERWREAVEGALLGEWVQALGTGTVNDAYVTDLLQRHTDTEHRHLRPLWQRKVRGKRTALLGEPVGTDLTVSDLLADHRSPESETLFTELADSRLLAVLRGLAADEQALARAWGSSGETWNQTALDAGLPAELGERVRRKLKRLGRQHAERTLAAAGAAR
nr:hypothetical protein KPHV_08360 [Kitasatospora purpeofusca]